ncbi:hypothetical protein PRVXH_001300 [Proteinivorax hydrogeniformans]|uniref:BlaR1 peptidase M56 n=1 Tax=Proteinivorax hydrogeniformans TaxID=1826727 RepID=A0AAU8HX46_9FIRM
MPASTTLPSWFWILFYAVLIITLSISIFCIIRRIYYRRLTIINLLAVITTPFVHFSESLGRPEGINEFEHLFSHLILRNLWAVYVSIGYIFILFWWMLFLKTTFSSKVITKLKKK